jgi:hypothetical protein
MIETLREYAHKLRGREADEFEMMRKRDRTTRTDELTPASRRALRNIRPRAP